MAASRTFKKIIKKQFGKKKQTIIKAASIDNPRASRFPTTQATAC